MIKSMIIFQNIKDIVSFEDYLSSQIMPEFFNASNLKRIQVTKYHPSGLPTPKNLSSIQIIVDFYWESIDAIHVFMDSPAGVEVTNLIANNPYGETGEFMCKERSFTQGNRAKRDLI